MSDYYLGEIRIFSFSWAPVAWALCDGKILPVAQNQALYALLGTRYGGTANTSFALPDLRGRVPLNHTLTSGTYASVGQKGGTEAVALNVTQCPSHNHTISATTSSSDDFGANGEWLATTVSSNAGDTNPYPLYGAATGLVPLNPNALSGSGAGQGHSNMQPFAVVNFCIATAGIFPSRAA